MCDRYLPRSSSKHSDHGALPPCPKSCQNMTRTWDTLTKNISVQLGLVRVDLTLRMIKKHRYSLKKHTPFASMHSDQLRMEQVVIKLRKSYFNIKNCITVLRRLCITMRRRAIALTYYFEAAGSRRPGGGHGVGFFYVCCLCCLLCCARSDSWLKFRLE